MAVQEKINPEELLEALTVIREVCRQNAECNTCPLRDKDYEDGCFILQTDKVPSNWIIKAPDKWRALQ